MSNRNTYNPRSVQSEDSSAESQVSSGQQGESRRRADTEEERSSAPSQDIPTDFFEPADSIDDENEDGREGEAQESSPNNSDEQPPVAIAQENFNESEDIPTDFFEPADSIDDENEDGREGEDEQPPVAIAQENFNESEGSLTDYFQPDDFIDDENEDWIEGGAQESSPNNSDEQPPVAIAQENFNESEDSATDFFEPDPPVHVEHEAFADDEDDQTDAEDVDDSSDEGRSEASQNPMDNDINFGVGDPNFNVANPNLQAFLDFPGNDEIIDDHFTVSKIELLYGGLTLANRHKALNTFKTDLFDFVNNLGSVEHVPQSKYLRDTLLHSRDDIEYHAVCQNCHIYIREFTMNEQVVQCTKCNYNNNVRCSTYREFFIICNIENDIRSLIRANSDYYQATVRGDGFQENVYRDINDGRMYRDFVGGLPAAERNSYATLTFNTDGSPVFKSSKFAIWPIQVILNEIPLIVRNKSPIIIGLWFGRVKPNMTAFLKPLVQNLNNLSRAGIDCLINNNLINIKVYALCCCVDSAARPEMQGMKFFTGYNGCHWCLQRGTPVMHNNQRSVIKYPLEAAENRTDRQTRVHMMQAVASDVEVVGIRKDSQLTLLRGFNIIDGYVPDLMHAGHLGVAKRASDYWFENPRREYGLSKGQMEEIDEYLIKFRPPTNVARLSRPLKDRKYWKAREWLNWTLHYSLPVLSQFENFSDFCDHWSLFVEAMHYLMQDTITEADVLLAERLLHDYAEETELIYGQDAMTYNLHQCSSHLVNSIRNWGPIKSHIGYSFESGNGKIVKMVKAANGVIKQICRSITERQALSAIENVLHGSENNKILGFCNRITTRNTAKTIRLGDLQYFGTGRDIADETAAIIGIQNIDLKSYRKLLKDNIIFKTSERRLKCSDNSFAKIRNNQYIRIEKFIVNLHDNIHYTICRKVDVINEFLNCLSVKRVRRINEQMFSIDTHEIMKSCVFMQLKEDISYTRWS